MWSTNCSRPAFPVHRSGRLLVCATNSVRDLDTASLRHGLFDYVLPIVLPLMLVRAKRWVMVPSVENQLSMDPARSGEGGPGVRQNPFHWCTWIDGQLL